MAADVGTSGMWQSVRASIHVREPVCNRPLLRRGGLEETELPKIDCTTDNRRVYTDLGYYALKNVCVLFQNIKDIDDTFRPISML